MPDALPAVTLPPSFLNAGFILASDSSVVSARGCSSVSKTIVPLREAISTGTICSANRPAAIAATARWWLASASASWAARSMPNFAATFSAVTPMWMRPNGSCSTPTV